MPVETIGPTYVQVTTFVCDRCGKKKVVEQNVPVPHPLGEDLENRPADDPLPAGWDRANHPDPSNENAYRALVFDTRSCMSAWFAAWIRVRYGGPEELPKRQVKPRKKGSDTVTAPTRPSPTQSSAKVSPKRSEEE